MRYAYNIRQPTFAPLFLLIRKQPFLVRSYGNELSPLDHASRIKAHHRSTLRVCMHFLSTRLPYSKDGIRTEFIKSDLTFGELVTFTRFTLSRVISLLMYI